MHIKFKNTLIFLELLSCFYVFEYIRVSHVMRRIKILPNIDWIFDYVKKLSIF